MPDLRPEYIVVHTAAFSGKDCDRDLIDEWHRARGWNGIGYHYVIINDRHAALQDGTVQSGRPAGTPGAHVEGLNMRSIGICCAGNGDVDPFTGAQLESLVKLISTLIDDHPALGVDSVIGHREVNRLVADGLMEARYRTSKSCPGKKVNMDHIRARVRSYRLTGSIAAAADTATHGTAAGRTVPTAEELRTALDVVSRAAPRLGNSADELRAFLRHPEVLDVRGLRRPDDGGDGRPPGGGAFARPDGGGGSGRPDE